MDTEKSPFIALILECLAVILVVVGMGAFTVVLSDQGKEALGLAVTRGLAWIGYALPVWICAAMIKLLAQIRDQLEASQVSHTKLLEALDLLADEARERKGLKKQAAIEHAAKQATASVTSYPEEW